MKDDFLYTLIGNAYSAVTYPVIAMTLNVKGGLVSGFLISSETYFDLCRQNTVLLDVSSGLERAHSSSFDSKEFIHLKNAQFSTLGQIPSPDDHGILWRGKLEDIDGFSILPLTAPAAT